MAAAASHPRRNGPCAATPALPGLSPPRRATATPPPSLTSGDSGPAPPPPCACAARCAGAHHPVLPLTHRLCACAPLTEEGVTTRLIGSWEANRCARGGLTHASHALPIRFWESVRRVPALANSLAAARVLFRVANQSGRRGRARGQGGQSPSAAPPRVPSASPRSKLGRQSSGRRRRAAPVYRLTAAGGDSSWGRCGRLLAGSQKCG